MPKGPRGEKRPADAIGAAIMVAKIATGEISERAGANEGQRKGGVKGCSKDGLGRLDEVTVSGDKAAIKDHYMLPTAVTVVGS
ncbi:MAG TPA: hypothetical protein VK683_02020, partial [Rhizomicrobium sp.]|nr:hypothetical protein [Rhizomicrobium sp.]